MGKNRKLTPREKSVTGDGPDEATVGGWRYKGKHKPLEGGTGQFEYTDKSGEKKVTHRFTLRRKGE